MTKNEHLTIDLFSFNTELRVNVISKPYTSESVLSKDFSNGNEDVPIPVVNAIDQENIPKVKIII